MTERSDIHPLAKLTPEYEAPMYECPWCELPTDSDGGYCTDACLHAHYEQADIEASMVELTDDNSGPFPPPTPLDALIPWLRFAETPL